LIHIKEMTGNKPMQGLFVMGGTNGHYNWTDIGHFNVKIGNQPPVICIKKTIPTL
jgi:hypothetical protein